MKKSFLWQLFLFPLLFFSCQQKRINFVNPFVGTGGHGHTYPGATMPFEMMQLSPDIRLKVWDGCSGYHYSDSHIYSFPHTHLIGTYVSKLKLLKNLTGLEA